MNFFWKKFSINLSSNGSIFLGIAILIIVGLGTIYKEKKPEIGNEIIPLQDGWKYISGDLGKDKEGNFIFTQEASQEWKKYTLKESINTEETKIIWAKIDLPKVEFQSPAIYFYNITDIYEAYIDNSQIYKDYAISKNYNNIIKGLNRHEILILDKSYLGKTLYLRIYSGWKDIGIAGKPLLGNAIDLLFYNLKVYFPIWFLGIACLCFSTIGFYFVFQRPAIRIVFYFSMFNLSIGIILLHHTPLKNIIWNSPMYWTQLNGIVMMCTIYFFLGFFSEFYNNTKSFYKITKIISILFILINSIFISFVGYSKLHFQLIERPGVFFVFIMLSYTVFELFKSSLANDKQAKILLIGISSMTISGISFFFHTIGIIPYNNFYFPIGFGILTLTIAIISVQKYTAVYELVDEYAKKLEVYNAELVEANNQLKDLNEFKERIFYDIHDHIGGDLSELIILQEQLKKYNIPENYLSQNLFLLKKINQSVRDKMLVIQDLNTIQKDFFSGLNIYLLRRYGSADRKCRFDFEDFLEDIFRNFTNSKKQILFSIATEIATNDLKYGYDSSTWKFLLQTNRILWTIDSKTNYRLETRRGEGMKGIQARLNSLEGCYQYSIEEGMFSIRIEFPI